MRAFQWERLLVEHRIPYITSGANVKRGEISVRCPFCGSADPSMHMGLNLENGFWSCWRNRGEHSGKSPIRLIMRLLNVPYGRAREIAGLGDDYIDPEGFDAVAARVLHRNQDKRPEQINRRFLDLDRSFVTITSKPRTLKFWNYLYQRGFNGESDAGRDVDVLVDLYNLHAGTNYRWGDRIVLPYYQDGDLVTWTARAVGPSTMRYKDLSIDESLLAPKETLYNHDCIATGGKVLVVVEGPFDALKLDFYGQPWGVRAVALSTNSVTDAQAFLLQSAVDKFSEVVVMMDNASTLGVVDSMRMKQALHFLMNVRIAPVPFGAKDAGELTPKQVIEWARALNPKRSHLV
jgi:hypothetical protein